MKQYLLLVFLLHFAASSHNDYDVIWCKRSANYRVYPTTTTTDAEAYMPDVEGGECLSYTKKCVGWRWTKGSAPTGQYFVGQATGCDVHDKCKEYKVKDGKCKAIGDSAQGLEICCCEEERCPAMSGFNVRPSALLICLSFITYLTIGKTEN